MHFINNSTKAILFSISISSLLLFSACDVFDNSSSNDDEPSGTNNTTNNSKTISGTAVDGYIKYAYVCLDINKNGICEIDKPSTGTSKDGTYTFKTTANGSYPILVSGGIDTATQENFSGTLKTTISLENNNSYSNIIVNPITTLTTNIYNTERKNDETFTYKDAKQIIASNLGLDISQIDADPLKSKETFVKTQQIMQTIKLLSNSIEKDSNNTAKSKKAFDYIMKQISLSVKDDTISADLNVSKIIEQLKYAEYNDESINISPDVEKFIKGFSQEIKIKV